MLHLVSLRGVTTPCQGNSGNKVLTFSERSGELQADVLRRGVRQCRATNATSPRTIHARITFLPVP